MLATELRSSFRFPLTSTVVEEPGISAVRNAILREARRQNADFVAMIDDDETASPDWLAQLLGVRRDLGVGVVGGPVTPLFPDSVPNWFRIAFRRRDRETGKTDLIDATGNVLISCEALAEIGWPEFDPSYGLSGGGDTEFFLRVRDLGITFAWADEAIVFEPVPPERLRMRWVLKRHFRYGNVSNHLSRMYRTETPTVYWAALNVVGSPLLLALAIHPRFRMKALRRLAFASGILAGALRVESSEYASRH
jgi:GT2 family glycosyltransferase